MKSGFYLAKAVWNVFNSSFIYNIQKRYVTLNKSYDYFIFCKMLCSAKALELSGFLSVEWGLVIFALPAYLQGCHEMVGFCKLQSIICQVVLYIVKHSCYLVVMMKFRCLCYWSVMVRLEDNLSFELLLAGVLMSLVSKLHLHKYRLVLKT